MIDCPFRNADEHYHERDEMNCAMSQQSAQFFRCAHSETSLTVTTVLIQRPLA